MVMDSCTEAKEAGLALRMDYFLVGSEIPHFTNSVAGIIKTYVNPDVIHFG